MQLLAAMTAQAGATLAVAVNLNLKSESSQHFLQLSLP